jgi:hypothetical protein
MQSADAQSSSTKPKLISDLPFAEQEKRGLSFARMALSLSFVMFMTFPLVNIFVGAFLLLILFGRALGMSAQRGKDLLWLLLGAVLCMAGWALPLTVGRGTTEFSTLGLFAEAILNFAIARFILLGPLAHIVFTQRAEA